MPIEKYIDVLTQMLDKVDGFEAEALTESINALRERHSNVSYIIPPDKEEFRKAVETMSNRELCAKYFVSIHTIITWKYDYGLTHKSFRKSVSDEEFKTKYESPNTLYELSKEWGVSEQTIRRRGSTMKLEKGGRPGFRRAISDLDFGKAYISDKTTNELASEWGTTAPAVRQRATDLGIKRNMTMEELLEVI